MPLREALFGKPAQTEQIQRFTPEQESALNQLLSFALPQLTSGQFDFGPIEQQARSGFAQKTIPSIAERFTRMGEGSQRGSGFAQTLGSAGAGLEESLASMKQQAGMQQQGQLANLLGMGLGQRFDTRYNEPTGGLLGGMAPGFGAGFGESFGGSLPGLIGGGLGAGASLLSKLLSGLFKK